MTVHDSYPMLSFDPTDGDVNSHLTHADTTPVVACPVGGNPMRLVKSLDGVRQCLTDSAFSFGDVPSGHAMTGAEVQEPDGGLLRMDTPELSSFRNVLRPFFAKRYVDAQRQEAAVASQAVVDQISTRGDVVDFHRDYSYPFIGKVVCENLGVAAEDWPFLLTSAEASLAIMQDEATTRSSKVAWDELYNYYDKMLDEKLQQPNDGKMISQLVHAFSEGGFARQEIVHALASVSNGYPAVLPVMDVAMVELLRHPEAIEAALQDPERWADVVDEALRLRAHFAVVLPRAASRDFEVEGTTITKGSLVLPSLTGAANDPNRITCPESFDPERKAPRSIVFGAGPHICPGATLTRQWLQVGFKHFFEAYPNAALAVAQEDLEWMSGSLPTPKSIPISLGLMR